MDLVSYSALKRNQVNFQVEKVFVDGDGLVDFKNAIAYKGKYEDKHGEHTVYVVHALNHDKGLQLIFDVLTVLFKDLDDEFKTTLKSIQKLE